VTDAIGVLSALGVPGERVHRELFYVGDEPPEPAVHPDAPLRAGAEVSVTLDGRTSSVTVSAGTTILDSAQSVRGDLPFECKGGVCGTCRARLVSGEAQMRRNYALEPHEVAAGFVLTCQTVVVGDRAAVDFDS
jgi:ring-1,2-phenylacetyl-CoA epoxidase subunit PaaE